MKKVARMRISPNNLSENMSNNQNTGMHSQHSNSEPPVRTTGRIKKPKAVFDPSDNYLPRYKALQLHTIHIKIQLVVHLSNVEPVVLNLLQPYPQ